MTLPKRPEVSNRGALKPHRHMLCCPPSTKWDSAVDSSAPSMSYHPKRAEIIRNDVLSWPSSHAVAEHYGSRVNQSARQRKQSPIYALRVLNNWVRRFSHHAERPCSLCVEKAANAELTSQPPSCPRHRSN